MQMMTRFDADLRIQLDKKKIEANSILAMHTREEAR